MNKLIKKAFTLVELLVVIAILAVLASVGVVSYTSFIDKAHNTAQNTLLTQMNTLIQANGQKFSSSKKAFEFLNENGVSNDKINDVADGYKYFYNRTKNKIELINLKEEVNSEIIDDSFNTGFGVYTDNSHQGNMGYYSFTASTTYTYQFIDSSNIVHTGDTVTEFNTIRYWLHVPYNYKEYKEYPILTFLHGTNQSLYVQCNESTGFSTPLSNYVNAKTRSMQMLSAPGYTNAGHGNAVWSNLYDDGSIVTVGGGTTDNCFLTELLKDIKQNESLDCFIVILQFNDEMWWENRGAYEVDDVTCRSLDILNSHRAGYGNDMNDGKYYRYTYSASQLGTNVWFQLLDKLYTKLTNMYSINTDRQYLLGFSLGGLGAFDMLSHYPDRFAAVVPIAAASSDPSIANVSRITNTRVYYLHGANDGWVSNKMGKAFIDAMVECGRDANDAKFATVSGYGHTNTHLANKTANMVGGYYDVRDFLFNTVKA